MFKLSVLVYATVVLIVISSNVIASPSFDCKKASTVVEKHICNLAAYSKTSEYLGKELQSYDNIMHDLYKNLSYLDNVKEDQKKWLKARNLCASDFKNENDVYTLHRCIMKHYNERVDKLFTLSINPKHMDTLKINKKNSCKLITGNTCTNINILSADSKLIYLLKKGRKTFIVEASNKGKINWKSLGLFNQYKPIRNAIWKNKTKKFPEHIRFIGDYRNGCPDCGTQDRLIIKTDKAWKEIDLRYYYLHYGAFSGSESELDIEVDVETGMLTIKSSTDKFRAAQVEDFSYFISKGKIVGNTFIPSSIETNIN